MGNSENERLLEIMTEFLTIYKLVNRKQISDVLYSELNTQQLIEIYQLTDGTRSTRELATALKNKCSHNSVSRAWHKWALSGIVVSVKQKGRYRAAFNLAEYGIVSEEDDE